MKIQKFFWEKVKFGKFSTECQKFVGNKMSALGPTLALYAHAYNQIRHCGGAKVCEKYKLLGVVVSVFVLTCLRVDIGYLYYVLTVHSHMSIFRGVYGCTPSPQMNFLYCEKT